MAESNSVSETNQDLSLVCQYDSIHSHPGDDVVLLCNFEPSHSAVSMEIRWWFIADLICHYKSGQTMLNRNYEGRARLSDDLHSGNVSLTLRDVKTSQRGQYICEVICGCDSVKTYIFLHISDDITLAVSTDPVSAHPGFDVILPAHLSPETSAVFMDIRWFRGTELIYQYRNGQEKTDDDFQNRVSLSIQDLQRGNVSLTLKGFQPSDSGDFTCSVFHNGQMQTRTIHLQVRDFNLVVPSTPVSADPGFDVILPAHFSPETSAVSMKIRWFRGTELIYQYEKKQEMSNNDFENRMNVSIQELQRGNLSLTRRRVQHTDSGDYICSVFHDGCLKTGTVHLQVKEPTSRRRNSIEGIRPFLKHSGALEGQQEFNLLAVPDLSRRRKSMEGVCLSLERRRHTREASTATEPDQPRHEEALLEEAPAQAQAPENAGATVQNSPEERQESVSTEQGTSRPYAQSQVQEGERTPESNPTRRAKQHKKIVRARSL